MNATRYLAFAGRLLIGLPFLVSGLSKLAAYGATIDFIMSSSLPLPPPLAYAGSVTVELACGALMIAGYQARVVASVLALFCLATAVFFHANFADPNQTFHFIKNLIMTGGLLQVVAFGAGAVSIDNRVSKGRARADKAQRALTAGETRTLNQAKAKRTYDHIVIGSGASGRRIDQGCDLTTRATQLVCHQPSSGGTK
jgi:putative oxidoreductase